MRLSLLNCPIKPDKHIGIELLTISGNGVIKVTFELFSSFPSDLAYSDETRLAKNSRFVLIPSILGIRCTRTKMADSTLALMGESFPSFSPQVG